jgi:hypothetical protein
VHSLEFYTELRNVMHQAVSEIMSHEPVPKSPTASLHAGLRTNYHDQGSGAPAAADPRLRPGGLAWANWRLTIPALAKQARVIAPDMAGFGFSDRPAGYSYTMDGWVAQAVACSMHWASNAPTWSATPSAVHWPWRWRSVIRSGCGVWC